ncbi:MAG: alpha/beta hydrolase [Chloroflexi bacterium]|nr:alpha/beta hydrolase [Chloroflexota bacterium]
MSAFYFSNLPAVDLPEVGKHKPHFEITPALKIHYRDHNPHGSPAVLLLHGLGATGDSWLMQIPTLVKAGYRVIAPDARGFGKSTYPGGGMSISDMAADMAALLQQAGITCAHIVGISMGGTLALQLALDHAELVHKLVLVNTFASLKPDIASHFFYFLLRLILVHGLGVPAQAGAVTRRIFPHPGQEELRQQLHDQIIQSNPRAYRGVMRSLALFDVVDRLGEIRAPTLVVTGENDTTVAPQRQRLMMESIPNSRQVVITDAGHAVTADQYEAFNRAMVNFLQG